MDKKKIEFIVTSCLVIAFILVAINSARAIAEKKQALSVSKSVNAKVIPLQGVSVKEEPKAEQNFEGPVYRDPFKRQAVAVPLSSDLKKARKINNVAGILVTGIMYDKEQPAESSCIINGEVLKTGESIDDFMVTGVKEDIVILTNKKENKEYKMRLWEEEG